MALQVYGPLDESYTWHDYEQRRMTKRINSKLAFSVSLDSQTVTANVTLCGLKWD